MTAVEPLTMDRQKAKELYRQYREHCRSKHTPEDRGIMLGYRALSEGKAVIDLYDVFRRCPADDNGLPRLAVGRAHWTHCWFERGWATEAAEFRSKEWMPYRNKTNNSHSRIRIPATVMNPKTARYYHRPEGGIGHRRNGNCRAVVPIIPANVRPKTALERYHLLWEAEWDIVPKDPFLLRHLHGSLYAVLAQWDLTELERMVLSHRL